MKYRALSLLIMAMTFGFTFGSSAVTEAAALTSTESRVDYARLMISEVLKSVTSGNTPESSSIQNIELVPGSLQIDELQPTIVDVGGAARALFGREKEEYRVSFRTTMIRNGSLGAEKPQLSEGQIVMVIDAIQSQKTDPKEDNNTTIRGVDPATRRPIKAQLFNLQKYVQPITISELRLKPVR